MVGPSSSVPPNSPASGSALDLPDIESLNLPESPSMLRNGRRRDWQNHSYYGPAREGPVRYISPASLTLERIMEQDRAASTRNNGPDKVPEMTAPGPVAVAKGKPRLLLMGQRRYAWLPPFDHGAFPILIANRSGKSSISSVVFHKMPPTETLFLESTARIQKDSMQ